MAILHSTISITALISVTLLLKDFNDSYTTRFVEYILGYSLLISFETFIHPTFCIRSNESLKSTFISLYPKLSENFLVKTLLYGKWSTDSPNFKSNGRTMTKIRKVRIVTVNSNYRRQLCAKSLPKVAVQNHQERSTTRRDVVEFRLEPQQHADILQNVWNTAESQFARRLKHIEEKSRCSFIVGKDK
uniref:Uncharacterized protein n=1 Tax=Romanomermis culicivorax TaxID=13658 RepID=A0A915LE43_ROMCU